MTALITRHARNGIGHTISQRLRAGRLGAWAVAAVLLASQAAYGQSRIVDDPFADGSWQLELSGLWAVEAWNYNISREVLYGGFVGVTYAVRDGIALTAGAPLTYVSQREVDSYVLGATFGVRGRVYRNGRTSIFLGVEVGVSEADTFVPPRGTRFNYLALGSAGAVVRIRSGIHVLGGVKWVHVSNSGLAGRHRNPDIEALGAQASVLIAF
jgi:hypothetical protein